MPIYISNIQVTLCYLDIYNSSKYLYSVSLVITYNLIVSQFE